MGEIDLCRNLEMRTAIVDLDDVGTHESAQRRHMGRTFLSIKLAALDFPFSPKIAHAHAASSALVGRVSLAGVGSVGRGMSAGQAAPSGQWSENH